MVWIEINDDQTWRLTFAERRDDVLDRGLGRELHWRVGKAETFRAQPHLRHCLLAGNVDRPVLAAGERGRDLDQQRRLADAGIAAEQEHRAADEAAAGDAVELGDARRQPRGFVGCAGQRLEREPAALARCASRHLWARGGGAFLGDGVPFTAGVALALPAAIDGAAVLANEAGIATGHTCLVLVGWVEFFTRPNNPS